MSSLVVISGCSGGGKSTLLSELSRRGYPVVEEPGRRIVAEELSGDGSALPWVDLAAFARKAISLAREDRLRSNNQTAEWTFFDRGLVDAYAALAEATGDHTVLDHLKHHERYHSTTFMAPPWPEIFCQDHERRHDIEAAIAEYKRLAAHYPALGYKVIELPKATVEKRADFVLEQLDLT